jgi:hypothetical protein
MAAGQDKICFENREFRGSRFRCLLATQQPKPKVIAFLNTLVQPIATVGEDDRYIPEGFCKPDEARLGEETNGFLSDEQREDATDWWLALRHRANTPNWDIISTCTIDGRKGLIMVEAKAHAGELNPNDCCGAGNEQNRQRIDDAIRQANQKLGEGWRLSTDSRYQLSNRFAWAWKVASLGVPVVLIYLGFLNASEMNQPFATHEAWERCLLNYADGTVPRHVWNPDSIRVNGARLIPLIRSADVNVTAS